MILPVDRLSSQKRVVASKEDLVFRADLCRSGIASQTFDIVNPGAEGSVCDRSHEFRDRRIAELGLHSSAGDGSVDPGSYQQQNGTITESLRYSRSTRLTFPSR
jgi:hypothetical protein